MYARGVDREVEWPGCTISVVGQQKRIVSAIIEMTCRWSGRGCTISLVGKQKRIASAIKEMTMQVERTGLHHLFSSRPT